MEKTEMRTWMIQLCCRHSGSWKNDHKKTRGRKSERAIIAIIEKAKAALTELSLQKGTYKRLYTEGVATTPPLKHMRQCM